MYMWLKREVQVSKASFRGVSMAFLISFAAAAQKGESDHSEGPENAAMQVIQPAAIEAHVRFLADDLLEGRGTGTRGYALAANYVAAQFQALGLEPAGVNGTFFQPIRFRSVTVIPESTSLKVVENGSEQNFVWGEDYFAAGDPRKANSSITAEVVFVGHGIVAPAFGINDYAGVDVRGKIVAYLNGGPDGLPSAERAYFGNAQTKLETAASRGAVGAIRVSDAEFEEIAPFARRARQASQPSMAWLDENGIAGSGEIRTLADISEQGAKKLWGGAMPEVGKPAAATPTISIITTSRHSEVASPNVAAVWRGADANLRNEYIIYSAHLDHLGIGPPVNGDSIYNGATDNAGSDAALIEIARAFTGLKQRQRRSIVFLAVTGEEKGLLGSDYFAAHPTVPRSQIVANINMDGLNLLFDFRNIVDIGGDHSSLGAVFRKAAAKLDVGVIPDPAPEQQFFVRSDQYSFVKRGIPALFPRTGTLAVNPAIDGAKMEADRMRIRYHQPNDDLNQPLDFVAGAHTARFNFLLGYYIAEDPARPRWNEGDFFGRTFGQQ
jgi:hypothetical protein